MLLRTARPAGGHNQGEDGDQKEEVNKIKGGDKDEDKRRTGWSRERRQYLEKGEESGHEVKRSCLQRESS